LDWCRQSSAPFPTFRRTLRCNVSETIKPYSYKVPAHVPPTRQLVLEISVRDIQRSIAFYQSLGFTLIRSEEHFAELGWEDSKLLLDERPALIPSAVPAGNVRVMVADVDALWQRCQTLGATVYAEIADRYYGLRDFTILDPDGFGIRFASDLTR